MQAFGLPNASMTTANLVNGTNNFLPQGNLTELIAGDSTPSPVLAAPSAPLTSPPAHQPSQLHDPPLPLWNSRLPGGEIKHSVMLLYTIIDSPVHFGRFNAVLYCCQLLWATSIICNNGPDYPDLDLLLCTALGSFVMGSALVTVDHDALVDYARLL